MIFCERYLIIFKLFLEEVALNDSGSFLEPIIANTKPFFLINILIFLRIQDYGICWVGEILELFILILLALAFHQLILYILKR